MFSSTPSRRNFSSLKTPTESSLVLIFLLVAIFLTRTYSYLLFHVVAELASIVIGVCVFIIAWNSASLLENSFLLILGIGSLYVSGVDLLHTLAFKGMEIFHGDEANLATQLWLVARYLEAFTFLVATLFVRRHVRREAPFFIFGVFTFFLLISIFELNIFPRAYIDGQGLTPFKIASEYVIIALFLIATAFFWRARHTFEPSVFYGIIASLASSITSEFAFTLYFGVTDTANLIGHLLKIIAFFLLYRALVEVGFTRPYDLLLRQLKQSEQSEREGRSLAEAELHASEERYRELMNNALVGVYQLSPDGKIVVANPELAHLLHANSTEELIGSSINKWYNHPRDRARLADILKKEHYVREFETDIWTRDGQIRHVLLSARQQNKALSGMVLDITERKHAEEKSKAQVEQLAALRSIDMAIISIADIHVSLKMVLKEAIQQLRVDAACVLLLNSVSQTLEYTEGLGFQKAIGAMQSVDLGEGFAGLAALERRTVSATNIVESPLKFRQKPLLEDENFISIYAVPLIIKGQVRGVLEIFSRSILTPDQAWLNFLETLAGQTAIAIDNATLFEGLQKSNFELMQAYDTTLQGWSHAMDLRDRETEGHTLRVTETTVQLARAAGMSEEELVHVRRGALLHDIGKMGVPDAILLKPGKLTDEEWVEMRKHPQYAHEMLAPIAYLKPALDIPYCHHEKWDGTGYPRGLKGEQIPLAARLFAVVDIWDALRSDRPYRKGWNDGKVYEYLKSLSGTHLDPKAVELFFKVMLYEMPASLDEKPVKKE